MEELKYIVEDSILAELLGVQNFSNKESAILELVKNAFDANALNVKIKISKECIEIIDDGCGMSREDIAKNWMHIGKSDKGYEIKDENGRKRVQAGSKGVGRFALARLGASAVVKSYKKNFDAIKWITNWDSNDLQNCDEMQSFGTSMEIRQLRDKWTEKAAIVLSDYLGRTYCDDAMKIDLFYEDKSIPVVRVFAKPKKGVNYATKISLSFDAKKRSLLCEIESDEFLDEAQKYCKNNIYSYSNLIKLKEEFENKSFEEEISNIEEILDDLGDFSAELYFGIDRALAGDEEKFLYKRRVLDDRYNVGIILYRNSFSISSYEGKKDWLGLGKRSRKSPAAATHPTGSWRVRENQISGFVNIDKKRNSNLQDLANRQGLDENTHYKVFVEILHTGISEFERYRQSIIRDVNKKNQEEKTKDIPLIDRIIQNPQSMKKLTKDEETKLVDELANFQKEKREYKKNFETTEKRYKYDVRILNVLATSGLKATSIAHEMRNARNKIDGNYEFIVKALQKYDLWDFLNDDENTKASHLNVPELLRKNKDAGIKLLQFMDVMLEDVEKGQFMPEEHNIKELLYKVKDNWETDYAWIHLDIKVDEQACFTLPEDVITVIFDNLILNSVQQNEKKRNRLNMCIEISVTTDLLYVSYKDDGIGLSDKFKGNPMKILEPHETSRKNGHGLGMWIVNNTLNMSGGEVTSIEGNDGFRIEFTIGGKL
ncbi:MAG: ATP-binding protein [Tyzzerella sp.]|nr:ATP-binding protein [Tyzzerella sp.]